MHPTQGTVGFVSVRKATEGIEKWLDTREGLEASLAKAPLPIVVGPGGRTHLIGALPRGRALLNLGVAETPARVEGNFSDQGETEFWKVMAERKWICAPNGTPADPVRPQDIPTSLSGLQDDPFLSLAAAALGKQGHTALDVPCAELRWADFFRTRIPPDLVQGDFRTALRRAVELTHSMEARNLPGYRGR